MAPKAYIYGLISYWVKTMAYVALYRKWRPTDFGAVKDQDAIVATLKNQILSDRVGHAYLFCGSRGTGKTTVAKIFAKAVNCARPEDGCPCGTCAMCRAVDEGNSMNVIEIDAASNNGVDNIREIREEVQYRPAEGKYRVYIIDEVHMLSTGAFNALLKTLEEPPAYVMFILATTEPHKIPATILSRCQRYDFHRITVEGIIGRLKELVAGEGVEAEDKALSYIARKADGGMRDAISLLDQCISYEGEGKLTYEKALRALGTVDSDILSRFLRALLRQRTGEALAVIEEVRLKGRELGQFVQDFVWYLRNLLLLMSAEATSDLLEISEEDWLRLEEEGRMTEPTELMRFIRLFSSLYNDMRNAADKRVLLEVAAIKATRPQTELELDSLTARVAMLERQLAEGSFTVKAEAAAPQAPAAAEKETVQETELKILSPAAWQDLQEIKDKWQSLVKGLDYQVRKSLSGVWLEPKDGGVMGIVFPEAFNYNCALRFRTMEYLEKQLAEQYGVTVRFDSRVAGQKEKEPQFVTDEELAAIHMEIETEG